MEVTKYKFNLNFTGVVNLNFNNTLNIENNNICQENFAVNGGI